jgi:DNA-cytosine methyltransferase
MGAMAKSNSATDRRYVRLSREPSTDWPRIIVIEDDQARAHRRVAAGVESRRTPADVTIRVHRVQGRKLQTIAKKSYSPGDTAPSKRQRGKAAEALRLLDRLRLHRPGAIVVAGPSYGTNHVFVTGLTERGYDFVVEVRPASELPVLTGKGIAFKRPLQLLRRAAWTNARLYAPDADHPVKYSLAQLASISLPSDRVGSLFAAQTGRIRGLHRGTVLAISSVRKRRTKQLLEAVSWARWIRPLVRREERQLLSKHQSSAHAWANELNGHQNDLPIRANIKLSERQDEVAVWKRTNQQATSSRRVFSSLRRINVVEIFAGAGGMGLGFLLAETRPAYRLAFSAEVDETFVATLNRNHETFRQIAHNNNEALPDEMAAVDLRRRSTFDVVKAQAANLGGVHLLIGGPPCQGFSNANRNSWHGGNPNNRMVEVFTRYVQRLQPLAFLMENVQGILWTHKDAHILDRLSKRFRAAGYLVFPKLLDSVWFGVPQYRSRFFLFGVRMDLGYKADDFGLWGPFPTPTHGPGAANPFVTVRDAIADLPKITNGTAEDAVPYSRPTAAQLRSNEFLKMMRAGAPKGVILDHITSRHADYVIERYKRIPPGGNWEDIAHLLTNYAKVDRTHSNIYRRLEWDAPSITIGHYRKSMLVHPSQHRGLSLREASRLQSFPDWFCFSGNQNGSNGGLVHKQQQLANAVCPLVTKAIAEFIGGL